MHRGIELAYLGLEVADRRAFGAFGAFLADVVGLVPGAPTGDGADTWRNDGKVHRLIVDEGPADDAVVVGFEAVDSAAFGAAVSRLDAAGYAPAPGPAELVAGRRVADLVHVDAPSGVRVELTHGLADARHGGRSPLVPGGFVTEGVGFGHIVCATSAFAASHHFVTEGLGMAQSDWVETEVAPGIDVEVRFYQCNERHHTLAWPERRSTCPGRSTTSWSRSTTVTTSGAPSTGPGAPGWASPAGWAATTTTACSASTWSAPPASRWRWATAPGG